MVGNKQTSLKRLVVLGPSGTTSSMIWAKKNLGKESNHEIRTFQIPALRENLHDNLDMSKHQLSISLRIHVCMVYLPTFTIQINHSCR